MILKVLSNLNDSMILRVNISSAMAANHKLLWSDFTDKASYYYVENVNRFSFAILTWSTFEL